VVRVYSVSSQSWPIKTGEYCGKLKAFLYWAGGVSMSMVSFDGFGKAILDMIGISWVG